MQQEGITGPAVRKFRFHVAAARIDEGKGNGFSVGTPGDGNDIAVQQFAFRCVAGSQESVFPADPDESPVIFGHGQLRAVRCQAVPVEIVHFVGGFVAVAVPLLGAQHFLTGQEERDPAAEEDRGGTQPVHGKTVFVRRVRAGNQELVPERVVVVGGNIVDHHGILHAPGDGASLQAAPQAEDDFLRVGPGRGTAGVAGILLVENAAFQAVPDGVVEDRDGADGISGSGNLLDIPLVRLEVVMQGRAAAGPAFTVDQGLRVDRVHGFLHGLHGLHIMEGHQVKPEAVQPVFLRPVADAVHNVFPAHDPVGGRFVAAAAAVGRAAVGIEAVIVIGNNPVQV